ncbi:hypothetical protein [uncultured Desulfovibrio sp.]|uniref:hypothetical protein n=1 Tax=uncultured Desulfovibrio sp. TaxID=167968 RepID=UPI0027298C1B|nr:hypothetical protein [uncultured Desulfovibrio sp.]
MADYSAIAARATSKIAEKGMKMVFVAQEEGPYDPATNTRPTTETRTNIIGIRTAPTVDEVQSGLFTVGATVILVAGNALKKPADTTDRLEFGGHRWDITAIRTVAPAEEILLYKFQVRDAGLIR